MFRKATVARKLTKNGVNRLASSFTDRQVSHSLIEPCVEHGELAHSPFAGAYECALKKNLIKEDEAQRAAAAVLSRVSADFQSYLSRTESSRFSLIPRLFAKRASSNAAPRGAYLWSASPGTGKTMLANMMFDTVESKVGKRRDHFHSFALDVHSRLHFQKSSYDPADKIGNVARDLATEFKLLVLDEFQVTDISEAVIVHQLFRKLFANGVVLVATSNRAPEHLYENGIQRELFTPFIPVLRERCCVHEMGVIMDYRLRFSGERSSVYFLVANDGHIQFDKKVNDLKGGFSFSEDRLAVVGRTLSIPKAIPQKRIAMFTFEDLCERPLSSADYIALSCSYHTIFVRDIPKLDVILDRNAVRRLTNFVDCAYEARVKLIVLAEAPADELICRTIGEDVPETEETFASRRTISRLLEMQSSAYLSLPWAPTMAVRT